MSDKTASETPTPRTDEIFRNVVVGGDAAVEMRDFCRTLERALHAAEQRAERLEGELRELRSEAGFQKAIVDAKLVEARGKAEQELAHERAARERAEGDVEKLRNLVDRALKMLWLALPETREPVHRVSNNPINAWVADAYEAIAQEGRKP